MYLPLLKLNQNTHWLDVSTVYGSDNATSTSLRNSSNGLLLTSTDSKNGRQLLPVSASCTTNACFKAGIYARELICILVRLNVHNTGDPRVNEQPQLTVIHTIWMREHNRVAKTLAILNPTWSRETVFQEARRIVIAEFQHITYNEFLPTLLGNVQVFICLYLIFY